MRCCEYFPADFHITIEQASEQATQFNWLDFFNCFISLVALFGGAWCFVQIRKLKEKQLDSIFSFLIRFRIRLRLMITSLEKYSNYILEALTNPSIRQGDVDDDNSYSEKIVESFLKNAKETLEFLLNSDNQIPIQKGWMEKYNKLIDFLDVYVKTEDKNFFIWNDESDDLKKEFYETHIINMKTMLSEIDNLQSELEKKLTRKFFLKKGTKPDSED